tara:strand:+ start:164 stop:895 length:732 start_codon:yes stop_codon:yes gene_type:complete
MSEEQVTQESATVQSVNTPPSVAPVAEPTRPEWLPEKFTTPEDMAKSYGELESWKGKKEEDIRTAIHSELEKEAFAHRPASAGEYQIPEVLDETEAVDNKLLNWWADYSWNNGLSQDEFTDGVNAFAEYVNGEQVDLEAVKAELGDNANLRVEAAQLFMDKFFPPEYHNAIVELGSSAEGIKALEFIQKQMQGTSLIGQGNIPAKMTHSDIEAKMKDERYWNPVKRDKAFVNEVNNDFQKLYG